MKYCMILGMRFEEVEAVTAIDLLRRAGVIVETYGVGSQWIEGRSRIVLQTDKVLKNEGDINPSDYGGILLPGGPGVEDLVNNDMVLKIVQKFFNMGKLVYAICAAPKILDGAGILKNKNYTCYPGTEIKEGKRLDDKVVIDGNIITSQGVGTSLEASIKLIEIIVSKEESLKQAERVLYGG